MIFLVRSGQVDKNPSFIVLIHVVTTGLKNLVVPDSEVLLDI